MAEILAENLSGKDVIGTDGAKLGHLYNITMDLKTGRLNDLVVEPANHVHDVGFEEDDHGRLLVPIGAVQAVKDHIVIRR
ncbi:PRC-barrel domain-containing protein [Halomarina ordinaria]|uniref:PRC-barrel domain-containing protein n=1 Tax=Halomarina ordinaria TaxID=3033939 RepID=A0ABD5UF12_9EURY|nr:PRC-barrel domain-containing protein [Halomarina sp. PSRA2]